MSQEFGKRLKELRLKEGFGLRRFAELIEIQPSNLSAIEHGRRAAPTDPDKLREIAEALGLIEGTDEWTGFFNAAAMEGEFPADIQHLAGRKLVPVLLRTIDNRNLSDGEIQNLIEEIHRRI